MRYLLFMLLLPVLIWADETPYLLRDISDGRGVSAINENFRSVSDNLRRTDLTNGGSVGGDLTVTGASTVSGNLAVSGALTVTGATTLNNPVTVSSFTTFNSSVTINGGTFGNVHNSTQSNRMTGINWGTTGLMCRSTLTVVGSTITIRAQGSIDQSAAAADYSAGYLINGACPRGFTCSATCTSNRGGWTLLNGGNTFTPFSLQFRDTVAHGSTNICIWACDGTGTDATGTLEFWLEAN